MRCSRTTRHAGQDGLEPPPLLFRDPPDSFLVHGLAEAFCCGALGPGVAWSSGAVSVVGRRFRWLRPAGSSRAGGVFPSSRGRERPRLAEFLSNDRTFRRICKRTATANVFRAVARAAMAPTPGPPASWPVPAITSPAELASYLELEPKRARLVRRLPDARTVRHGRGASPLSLPLGAQAVGLAPADRSAQAAVSSSFSVGCSTRSCRTFRRTRPPMVSGRADR